MCKRTGEVESLVMDSEVAKSANNLHEIPTLSRKRLGEHGAIVEGLRMHDKDKTSSALEGHLRTVIKNISNVFAEEESQL